MSVLRYLGDSHGQSPLHAREPVGIEVGEATVCRQDFPEPLAVPAQPTGVGGLRQVPAAGVAVRRRLRVKYFQLVNPVRQYHVGVPSAISSANSAAAVGATTVATVVRPGLIRKVAFFNRRCHHLDSPLRIPAVGTQTARPGQHR